MGPNSILNAILKVLVGAAEPLSAVEVVERVRAIYPEAGAESVRTMLSTAANQRGIPVAVSRRGYSHTLKIDPAEDLGLVTNELRRIYNAVMTAKIDITPDGYPNASGLALIDAIYSANSHYGAVINVIRRVKQELGIDDGTEFTVEDLISHLRTIVASCESHEDKEEALKVFFGNRSFSTNGLPKALQVGIIGLAMLAMGKDANSGLFPLNSTADFERINQLPIDQRIKVLDRFEREFTKYRGMGPATYRYLMLLNGVQVVKPDRMVIRWLAKVLGRSEALISPRQAAELLEEAANTLQAQGYPFSVIAGDHVIWQIESGRLTITPTDLVDPRQLAEVFPSSARNDDSGAAVSRGSGVHRTSSCQHLGEPCGRVVGFDNSDPEKAIVEWSVKISDHLTYESAYFSVEELADLDSCDEGRGAQSRRAEPTASQNDFKEVELGYTLEDFGLGVASEYTLEDFGLGNEGQLPPTSRVSGSIHHGNLDNHTKIEQAVEPYKGKTFSTSELWLIVKKKWGESFNPGSFLPNDHASGNLGACWCAKNRQGRPLFERVRRGTYRVL